MPAAAENRGSRNSFTSSDGNSTRRSQATNAARIAAPPSIAAQTTGRPKPCSPPLMMPYVRPTRPTTDSSTPTRSMRPGFGSRDSGTRAPTRARPSSTTGTLIRKTDPHQKRSSSAPPTIGPIATPRPTAPAHSPMARARSRGSKTFEMIDRVAGMIAAAPTPISARAPMSCPGLCAYAEASEARPNKASPMARNRLRPNRSPSTPKLNSRPAKTRV